MEVFVCVLTTLFFAAVEITDLKIQSVKRNRAVSRQNEFVVLPHLPYSVVIPASEAQAGIQNRIDKYLLQE